MWKTFQIIQLHFFNKRQVNISRLALRYFQFEVVGYMQGVVVNDKEVRESFSNCFCYENVALLVFEFLFESCSEFMLAELHSLKSPVLFLKSPVLLPKYTVHSTKSTVHLQRLSTNFQRLARIKRWNLNSIFFVSTSSNKQL